MKILRANLSTCEDAEDLIVAIDVLRAFTTAAYMFAAGVREIILATSVDEAISLRAQIPDSLISGEVNGVQVPGFDMGNSPYLLKNFQLAGKTVIQRTSAGTQAVGRARRAKTMLTASLVNLSATVEYIQKQNPEEVTLIQTGYLPEEGWGDEDVACAEIIEARLLGKPMDTHRLAERVRSSRSGLHFTGSHPDFPPEDIEMALDIDRFSFVMLVEKKNGLFIMHPVEG